MNNTQRILMWIGVLGGILLLFFGLIYLGTKNSAPTTTGSLTQSVTTDEHIKGNPGAPVTLVEYSDFQCPACAAVYPLVTQLAQEYPGNLRIVYRHFPLRQIHPQAQLAAQASEAAAKQGKFWDMHDMLFNTQSQWSNNQDAEQFFIDLAGSLELNIEQFKQDLNSSETKNAVNEDYASGTAANVQGTPSFYLNGTKIQNPRSYDEFKRLIDEAIEQSQ